MDVIANDINALLDLFQKDRSTIDEVVETNPASFLARLLQLRNEIQRSASPDEMIQRTALYTGNLPWFELLLDQIRSFSTEETTTGHFAVNIPVKQSEHIPVESKETSDDHPLSMPVNDIVDSEHFAEVESLESEADLPKGEPDNFENTEKDLPSIIETTAEQPEEQSPEGNEELKNEITAGTTNSQEEKQPEKIFPSEESPAEANAEQMEDQPEESMAESDKEQLLIADTPEEESVSNENIASHDESDAPIAFEPLHTVDYFASQGIKLNEDDLANDRLGQQVKSFTGWLKSMKKLHPGKLPEQDDVIQQIIQSAAEVSNAESDVLTEAMAEVLVKQNKKEKAIQMYEKLSLINPSKSAYFAAKISSLKTP